MYVAVMPTGGLQRIYRMNTSTVIDFIKARWHVIAVLTVVSLIAILVLLFMVGLFVLHAEVTSSSGVVIFWDQ
uniref:Uncharacterized protein n=1 Tax=Candidatus Methanogaster sp. ANME-2c ERB4 TaxID=2759911 RepID=A0A7G9YBP1_9EURY|nr:hypothetical protein HFNPJNGC_00001 [Methanosarcinales archaeon ANME-2c ERB4]